MALTLRMTQIHTYHSDKNYEDVIIKDMVYPVAYLQITNVNGNKDKCVISVCTYADSKKEQRIDYNEYVFTPSMADGSSNFIKQGYEYLKALPELVNAVDC